MATAAEALAEVLAGKRTARRAQRPCVERLTVVELYLDRATDAWRALQLRTLAHPQRLALKIRGAGRGGLARTLLPNYRGTDHDLISARVERLDSLAIAFRLSSAQARSDLTAQGVVSPRLIDLAHNSGVEPANGPEDRPDAIALPATADSRTVREHVDEEGDRSLTTRPRHFRGSCCPSSLPLPSASPGRSGWARRTSYPRRRYGYQARPLVWRHSLSAIPRRDFRARSPGPVAKHGRLRTLCDRPLPWTSTC